MSIRWAIPCLVLVVASRALAQPATSASSVSPQLSSAVSRLAAQENIRISYLTNWMEGVFVRSSRDSMVMQVGSLSQPVSRAVIDTLFSRRRSTVHGAIAGALLGGAIGALAGLGYEHKQASFGQACDCNTFPTHGILIGVGGGAALGAALGHTHFRWHRIYARKAPWE
jgi:hypothetical protein